MEMDFDEKTQKLFAQEKMGKLLFMMSFPVIIAVAISAVYNIVDTIFISRSVGILGVAGIGIGFPIQLLVNSIGLLLGLGGMSVISRALGAGKHEDACKTLGQTYVIGAIFYLLLLLSLPFIDSIISALGANAEVAPYAREYLLVILPGSIFILTAISAGNLFMAQGKPALAMVQLVTGALLNIALDPLFIFVFDMGVTGAAIATVISQGVSLLLVLYFQFSKQTSLTPKVNHFIRIDPRLMGQIVVMGIPGFLQEVGVSILIVLVNNIINRIGAASTTALLAIFGILNRLLLFIITPLIGIAQGFMPIAGFNYGAGNTERMKSAFVFSTISSVIVTLVIVTIVWIFPERTLSVFTTDPDIIAKGIVPLRLMFAAMPLVSILVIITFYFMGIGKPVPAIAISLARQLLFFVPVILILSNKIGIFGVWLSFPIADLLALVFAIVLFRFSWRKQIGILSLKPLES